MGLISRKLCKFLLMFSTGFTSVSYFFFLHRSPSSSFCMVFNFISSNIDEVLLINPSANVFLFGDFNVHHKDWLTYSVGTDRPVKLCYNFYISNDLTQMVNFPTRIPDCDSHSPALGIYVFLLKLVFVLQWLSLHWEILIMLLSQFPMTFHKFTTRCSFHCIAYNYSHADWDSLVPWMFHGRLSSNSVPLLLLVNFVSRFRLELMYISLIVSVTSSPWFLRGYQVPP